MDTIASENICYPAKLAHGHVIDLLDREVRAIFYPCVSYEQMTTEGGDDRYNCSIVAEYPELIVNNIDRIRDENIRFIRPFLNLANRKHLVERLTREFSAFRIGGGEIERALAAGFAEDAAFRAEVKSMGQRALEFMSRTGTRESCWPGGPTTSIPRCIMASLK